MISIPEIYRIRGNELTVKRNVVGVKVVVTRSLSSHKQREEEPLEREPCDECGERPEQAHSTKLQVIRPPSSVSQNHPD